MLILIQLVLPLKYRHPPNNSECRIFLLYSVNKVLSQPSYLFLLGKRTRNADAGKHNRKRSAVVLAVVAFGCELHPAAAGIDAAVYRTAGHDANAFPVEKVRKANFSAEMSGHCVHLEIRECNGVKIRFFFISSNETLPFSQLYAE